MSLADLRSVLSPLDEHFALALRRISGQNDESVLMAAALASRAVQRGHVCADLVRIGHEPLLADDETQVAVALPEIGGWMAALRASALVSDGSKLTPLVLDEQGRLYLYRYFDYQRRLAQALEARAQPSDVNIEVLRDGLRRLFHAEGDDEQKLAALVVLTHRLAVVSGGPGTGKTTTVTKILALVAEQATGDRAVRMTLLSPTGKAASRLGESIRSRVGELDCSERVKSAVIAAAEPATIHRGLGFDPGAPTRFRYGADNPLAADVVVVDEASMVDLALMTKLVEAAPQEARVVLLGDKDQLASVEAGAILGDIYHSELERGWSAEFADLAASMGLPARAVDKSRPPGIQDCMVHLEKSYRYELGSGIGALARAVNLGDVDRALSVLTGETTMPYGQVALCALDERHPLDGALGGTVVDGFAPFLESDDPLERLRRLGRFRVLCVHRRGPLGAETINAAVERHLAAAGRLKAEGTFYDGRPILIVQNDYQLGLFNGDVGVVAEHDGRVRVAFAPPAESSAPRWFDPGRLPPHETVFAMTVHKSQGSEFDRVALLLPSAVSPIVTRELVYTGVSRARERVDLYGSVEVLRDAIGRRIERASGLRDLLWRRWG